MNENIQFHLSQHLDKYFLLYLSAKQAGLFNSVPIKPEPREYSQTFKFVSKTSPEIKILRYKTFIYTVIIGILFIQCLFFQQFSSVNPPNISDTFLGFFCLMLNGLQACYLQFTLLHGSTLEYFLNIILKFSRKNTQNFMKSKYSGNIVESFNLVLVPMLMFSITIFIPCFVFGLHWINPCKPSLLGYFLLDECRGIRYLYSGYFFELRKVLLKISVYIVNLWMWYFGAFCICFVTSAISLICPVIASTSIKALWYQLHRTRDIAGNYRMYREIHLLNSVYNEIQKELLGVLILGAIFCATTNLTLLIKI